MRRITCDSCDAEFFLAEGQDPGTIHQCPACGSTPLTVHIEVSDDVSLQIKERLDLQKRQPGARKWFEHIRSGDDYWRKRRRWVQLFRRIDRAGDWYEELIVDHETGEVIRRCEEPLSQHRDHGDAARSEKTASSSDDD